MKFKSWYLLKNDEIMPKMGSKKGMDFKSSLGI